MSCACGSALGSLKYGHWVIASNLTREWGAGLVKQVHCIQILSLRLILFNAGEIFSNIVFKI